MIQLKAPITQVHNRVAVTALRKVSGHVKLHEIEPSHVYRFHDLSRSVSGEVPSRRAVAGLSNAFTKAIRWGHIKDHPIIRRVRLEAAGNPRKRYVKDAELAIWLSACPPKRYWYTLLKLVTSLPKQDILVLKLTDISELGLDAQRRRTKAQPRIFDWDEEGRLKEILDGIVAAQSEDEPSPFLFHTRTGKPYYLINDDGRALKKPAAFNMLWRRAMTKAKAKGMEPFAEHDLRPQGIE